MVNLRKYTYKAQDAVQEAQNDAQLNENPEIKPYHFFEALLNQENSILTNSIERSGGSLVLLTKNLEVLKSKFPKVEGGTSYLSNELNTVFAHAEKTLGEANEYVTVDRLILSLFEKSSDTKKLLKQSNLSVNLLIQSLNEIKGSNVANDQTAEANYQALDKYTLNFTELAEQGKLDPTIGRDDEIRRVIHILSRRRKNNPILLGEPGTGKTAIAEGLAQRIVNGDVPESMKGKLVLALDMGALVAGAKFRGEFEDRLKSVVKEIEESDGKIILFLDEAHLLIGAGATAGAMDASNLLKPALARGVLHCIGATTFDEYKKYIEKDAALERRFQKVMINEPSETDTVAILRGLKERYEVHHGVRIQDAALIAAVVLSSRYISDRFLPDKAIDLVDEAAAALSMEIESVPVELDELSRKIKQYEMEKYSIKRETDSGARKRMLILENDIEVLQSSFATLESQWVAEKKVIDSISEIKAQIEEQKIKMEHAQRAGDLNEMSKIQYGTIPNLTAELDKFKSMVEENTSSMLREEIGEEDIAKVVSTWTGIPVNKILQEEKEKLLKMEDHLGKRVVGQFEAISLVSQTVRRARAGLTADTRPLGSFIFLGSTGVGKTELSRALAEFLFDNEEMMIRLDLSEYKESHSIAKLIGSPPGYVGYDEGGQLTEQVRRKPYSVILLDEIEKAHPDVHNLFLQILDEGRLTDSKGRTVDFTNTVIIATSNIGSQSIYDMNLASLASEEIKSSVFEEMKNHFPPEFINRFDEVIIFNTLKQEHMLDIVEIQIKHLETLLKNQDVSLQIGSDVKEYLAQEGFDPSFGARPLKRAVQRFLTNPLANYLLSNDNVEAIEVKMDGSQLEIKQV